MTSKQRTALAGAMRGGLDRRTRVGEKAGAAAVDEELTMATMRVPKALWRAFKAQAATEGTTVQDLGREAMETLLTARQLDSK